MTPVGFHDWFGEGLSPWAETGSYGVEWDVAIRRTGEILGRQDAAEEIVTRVEARFDEVRAAHPEYAGKTAAMGFPPGPSSQATLASSADPRFQTLLNIGFDPAPAIVELDEQGVTGQQQISNEQLDKLEADLLLLYAYTPEQRTDALAIEAFSTLDVVENGHLLWIPEDVANALTFGTAIAIEYVLQQLPGLIEETL